MRQRFPLPYGALPDAEPKPINELAAFSKGDPATVPAIVTLADGTHAYFVRDTVRAMRETPRLQLAYDGAPILNNPIKEGETFRADWLFRADDGNYYYYTPYATRVRQADTVRVSDTEAVG